MIPHANETRGGLQIFLAPRHPSQPHLQEHFTGWTVGREDASMTALGQLTRSGHAIGKSTTANPYNSGQLRAQGFGSESASGELQKEQCL